MRSAATLGAGPTEGPDTQREEAAMSEATAAVAEPVGFGAAQPGAGTARPEIDADDTTEATVVEEVLVEEVSIDGMCGVY
jgi:mycofactocin precursor